jgi:hypothetical protein
MSIQFLGKNIIPSRVISVSFFALAKDLTLKNLEALRESGAEMQAPKVSQLHAIFRANDPDENVGLPGLCERIFDSANFLKSSSVDNQVLGSHDDVICNITHEFNRMLIVEGYPASFMPTSMFDDSIINCDFESHVEGLLYAAEQTLLSVIQRTNSPIPDEAIENLDDIGYPISYLEEYERLQDKITNTLTCCTLSKALLDGQDAESRVRKEGIFMPLCREGVDYLRDAFKAFNSAIPMTEKLIHEAAFELAVCVVEYWIISGLYFPKEDTRDFLPSF